MKAPMDLRELFYQNTGIEWKNSQGEPDIDYVAWLEDKLCRLHNSVEPLNKILAE